VVGGGDLAGQFADAGALDRMIFTMVPVALARGAPLFPRRYLSDRVSLAGVERVGEFVEVTYELNAAER
jgi:dihydrofolate reductase